MEYALFGEVITLLMRAEKVAAHILIPIEQVRLLAQMDRKMLGH